MMVRETFSPEAIPSELLAYESPSTRQEMEALWPGHADTAMVFVTANNLQSSRDTQLIAVANQVVAPLKENHAAYLAETGNHLLKQADRTRSKLEVEHFSPGDATFFAYDDNKPRQPLDLTALGLPPLKPNQTAEDMRPLAIVLHRKDQDNPGKVTGVGLILSNGSHAEQLFLENIPAAQDPGQTSTAQWLRLGKALATHSSVQVASRIIRTEKNSQTTMELKSTASRSYDNNTPGTAVIIRPRPTKAEAIARRPATEKKLGKLSLAVRSTFAVGLAGLALALNVPKADAAPAKNREITTAQEMVGSGISHEEGVHQAESFFDDSVLNRSRKAFDAYFKGDVQALKDQVAENGYVASWISQESLAAIQKAQNTQELKAAFQAAMQGLPVTFDVFFPGESEGPIHGPDTFLTHATDLGKAKSYALAITKMFNRFNKNKLKIIEPVDYCIVGSVVDKDGKIKAGGYYTQSGDRKRSQIVLAEYMDPASTTAHETGHYFDLNQNDEGDISPHVASHNPPSYRYNDDSKIANQQTEAEGWHNVAGPYGNKNRLEDMATASESILVPEPILSWERSPFGEKQEDILLKLEELFPGHTADMLLNTTTRQQPPMTGNLWNDLQKNRLPATGVIVLTLAAMAVSRPARNRIVRGLQEAHGVRAKKGQRLLVYNPTNRRFEQQYMSANR